MSGHEDPTPSAQRSRRSATVRVLEQGDGIAHLFVAGLLLVLAVVMLLGSTYHFVRDLLISEGDVSFSQRGLNYLSDLLFGVIILEVLSTIITYIQARNLSLTVKDFLVVGLISSVRKILLTGAQSSITKPTTEEFVQEAIGTAIMILGICLLIGGIIFLDRNSKSPEPADSR